MHVGTSILDQCVYLDNFTIMNASYSKKCFKETISSEILVYIASYLNIKISIQNNYISEYDSLLQYVVN